jgi:hypothetical protein
LFFRKGKGKTGSLGHALYKTNINRCNNNNNRKNYTCRDGCLPLCVTNMTDSLKKNVNSQKEKKGKKTFRVGAFRCTLTNMTGSFEKKSQLKKKVKKTFPCTPTKMTGNDKPSTECQ